MAGRSTEDKQTAIFAATLTLVSERGFHGTPMSQIAKQAGIAVGTIYQYFSSKEELVSALYVDVKRRLTQSTLARYSPNATVGEGFKQIFAHIVRYCVAHPQELSFAEQCENSPLITPEARTEGARVARPIQELFGRAREQGLLKPLPDASLGAIVGGAVIALAKLRLTTGELGDETVLDAELTAVWDAIRA
jgi:TetR/AcrR family transcriptional regulator, repressor of fatR-cypB operon